MSWVDDGANTTESDGLTVVCNETDPGSPSNALFKGFELNFGEGFGYWTVTFEEVVDASPFVGLTSADHFGKGWCFSGYMYGGPGNTSSGGAGQLFGYGEPIKTGDTIGILAEASETNLHIYYFHNGRPLGLAFDLPAPYFNPLYPVISFSGKAKATIAKGTNIPSENERNRREDFDPNSIVGSWELQSSELATPGSNPTVYIKPLDEAGNEFNVSLHILNYVSVHLKKIGEETWSSHVGATTLMGGSPEMMSFESSFCSLVGKVNSVRLEGGQLVFAGNLQQSIIWKRYAKVFTPTTSL